MSTLVDHEIQAWAYKGGIRPFEPLLVNPVSINLRIGHSAKIETPSGLVNLDLSSYSENLPYLVPPGSWLLASTMEMVTIPGDMCGMVVLRSSAARRGWDHAQAGFVDAGWQGVLTLEFVNCLKYSFLPIYPGQQLVQLKLEQLREAPAKNYSMTGRYHGASTVEACKDSTL
jgi:dCTP deaminase